MEYGELPFSTSAASLLPAPLGNIMRPFEPALRKMFFPEHLVRTFNAAESNAAESATGAAAFGEEVLRSLDIRCELPQADLERIPASGGALLVANHPFGILEGLILLSWLQKVRPDYRIVANSVLGSVPAVRERLILVNPFGSQAAARENGKGLRACVEWLASGGLLVMLPAGEVSHLNMGERFITDPKWNSAAARLARKIGCPTVPVFFGGTNSLPFQMMGMIHPSLRTLSLARELAKKSSQVVRVRVGNPVSASVLRRYPDAESATDYLRARTYLLGDRLRSRSAATESRGSGNRNPKQLAAPGEARDMVAEVEALGPDRLLAAGENLAVYAASAGEIPHVLADIGRARELTFRQVGEGTGKSSDLDAFDDYYRHIFLWDSVECRVAGAYRMVATPDVLPSRGIKGLYTSTLFHYEPAFFEQIGPAFELGRSFIRQEYQKHYAPLLLLWKGISRCVQQRPECPVLFGAVSISGDYHALSRTLIMNFLNGRVTSEISGLVKPRRSARGVTLVPKHVSKLSTLLDSIEELSSSISDLERDRKGVPVLIRHYLKIGGELLGFNVDPQFSNALDALVLADLRKASPAMLERCMGRSGAAEFRGCHGLGA